MRKFMSWLSKHNIIRLVPRPGTPPSTRKRVSWHLGVLQAQQSCFHTSQSDVVYPSLKREGKGLGTWGCLLGLIWPALGARADTAKLKQILDLIG